MSASSSPSSSAGTLHPREEVDGSIYRLSPGLRDYLCGTLSGFGKVVAGYPFDTIKGRVQTNQFPSVYRAVVDTIRHEGPLSLYQGVTMPAINVCFVGGILFYVNGFIRSAIQPDPIVPLSYGEMAVAGTGAGFVIGVVITPLEVVKLRLQIVNKKASSSSSSSSNSAAKQMASRSVAAPTTVRGILRSLRPVDLAAGFTPTLIRECGTFGLFFPANEYLKRKLAQYKDGIDLQAAIDRQYAAKKALASSSGGLLSFSPHERKRLEADTHLPSVPFSTRVLAAGLAGIIGWLPVYPSDQIKSRMQIHPAGTYRSWLHCGLGIVKEEGVRRGLFKGMTPCLIRAFPAYAAQYLLFEYLSEHLS